jgi:hypothetical protein
MEMGIAFRAAPAGPSANLACQSEDGCLKDSKLRAIATDAQFWIPLVVLVLGTALLLMLR